MNHPPLSPVLPRLLIAAALVSAPGCSEASDSGPPMHTVVDTVAGVTYVTNPAQGAWSSDAAWAIEAAWSVGGVGAQGPEAFGDVRAVSLGPDDRVYVIDGQTSEVLVFGDDGEFIRSFGGRGEGPGEFGVPIGLAWSPEDQLWVPDLAGRYSVFDTAGAIVSTFPRPPGPILRVRTAGAFDSTGSYVDEMAQTGATGTTDLALFRVTAGEPGVDTLAPVSFPRFDLRDREPPPPDAPVPAAPPVFRELAEYRPRLIYAITPSGSWATNSSELTLVQRTFMGDTLRVVNTQHRPAALGTPDARAPIDEALRGAGFNPEDFAFGPQVVRAVYAHPDGHVLALIDVGEGAAGSALDVFDLAGRFMGTVEVPFMIDPEVPVAFRGDDVVLVVKDSLDVQSVIRARLLRR